MRTAAVRLRPRHAVLAVALVLATSPAWRLAWVDDDLPELLRQGVCRAPGDAPGAPERRVPNPPD